MSSELFIPNKETPYFYIIQHKQSGKKYAGCRYAKKCNPIELLKQGGYSTSSNRVNKIIEEEGLDAFEIVEILTEDQIGNVRDYETKFLIEHQVNKSDQWFNVYMNQTTGFGTQGFKDMMIKIHGVEYRLQIPGEVQKDKENYKRKTGYDNPIQNPEIRKKIQQTNMEKLGVPCNLQHESTKSKMRKTNLNRYGSEYTLHTEIVKSKIKETNIKKYGTEIPQQSEEIKVKKIETCQHKYGGNSPMCSEEVQEKSRKSMKEIYGYEYNGQRPEVRQKMIESMKNRRSYKGTENPASGKKWMYLEGTHYTYVPSDKVEHMLGKGYTFGMKKGILPKIKFKDLE